MVDKQEILKIKISNVNYNEVLEEVKKWFISGSGKHSIFTPNPEIIVAAQKNKKLKQIINNADLALPDGIGLVLASRFLGRPLKERVTGADFMEKLCEWAEVEGLRIGLIGGGKSVAAKAVECLKKKHPKLKVVLAAEEWGDWGKRSEIGQSTPLIDFLFVAFGAPKQEIWISENLPKLPVKVAMGVGGGFDYLAGLVPRAPKWVQKAGFEWFWRLIHQPWRVRRQLNLLYFIFLVFREKYFQESN